MSNHVSTAPAGTSTHLRAVAFGVTDRGMQREHNEDSFIVLDEYALFIVADGMGGHRAGDVASRIATETIAEFFRSTASEDVTWPFHFDTSLTEEENRLVTGIRVANRQILDKSERSRECQGMGTTVVGAMYSSTKNRVFIGHVGDSRCYRVRQSEIKLLTRDHSLLNDYILAIPNLTDEQKADLPRNVITRALGMQKDVVVDLQSDEPQQGDVYVLCSDGLNGMLRDEEILAAVAPLSRALSPTLSPPPLAPSGQPSSSAQTLPAGARPAVGPSGQIADLASGARLLIDQANANGGEDNITVVLIRIEAENAAPAQVERSIGDLTPSSSAAPPAPLSALPDTAAPEPSALQASTPLESPPIQVAVAGQISSPSFEEDETVAGNNPPAPSFEDDETLASSR
jgi:protein phosphatase